MRWLPLVMLLALLSLTNGSAEAQRNATQPDCAGVDNWAASMAFVHLKNAAMTDNNKIDFTKTKVVRLASQQIGKDLYRQIHDVKYTEKSGNIIETITMNDASHQECSMSAVDVFVVAKHLGGR
jgi:hypothetical protein